MNQETNHIKASHDEDKSWCGEFLSAGDHFFKDAEHAAINGDTAGRFNSCEKCVERIIKCLEYKSDEGIT